MSDLEAFQRSYGIPGQAERRTFPLAHGRVAPTGSGDGRLKVIGHAAVFNSPSVELNSRYGSFTEFIDPHAFDDVLRRNPDVVLTWDHDTRYPLARTRAGNLELSVNVRGLRYFATVTPTSYAEDLRNLMADGVVNESSFSFTVSKDGQEWEERDGQVVRHIMHISELYDVCVCVSGAYPATDSGIARKVMLDYAVKRGYLSRNPDTDLAAARLKADLQLRRRRLSL